MPADAGERREALWMLISDLLSKTGAPVVAYKMEAPGAVSDSGGDVQGVPSNRSTR
jgi:hypothetical protein